jgi:hypothetical protein
VRLTTSGLAMNDAHPVVTQLCLGCTCIPKSFHIPGSNLTHTTALSRLSAISRG